MFVESESVEIWDLNVGLALGNILSLSTDLEIKEITCKVIDK